MNDESTGGMLIPPDIADELMKTAWATWERKYDYDAATVTHTYKTRYHDGTLKVETRVDPLKQNT